MSEKMYIKKIGHCCLLIEYKGLRIVTDPGDFAVEVHSILQDIDMVLITHDHPDHIHAESMEGLVKNNPDMKIITNTSVGNTLDSLGITCEILEHGESLEYESILVEGFGNEHAEIFGDFSATQNTGYFIDNKMFYPGDAFTDPGKPVSILAVPVSAPWMALKEAINYVADLKPGRCFPVHDGVLSAEGIEIYHRILEKNISKEITFASLRNGGELYIM